MKNTGNMEKDAIRWRRRLRSRSELSFEEFIRAGDRFPGGQGAHMAVLPGMAGVLTSLKEELRGTIKVLFQSGEEADGRDGQA